MIATLLPTRQDRSLRTTAQRVGGYAEALRRRRRFLVNMSTIYRHEWRILVRQVEACLSLLAEMRQVVLAAQTYLHNLELEEAKRLQPHACVTKLADLDSLLTEILLYCAVFEEVCETTKEDRVHIHLTIRDLFPMVLVSYDDTHAMLAALATIAQEQEQTAPVVQLLQAGGDDEH